MDEFICWQVRAEELTPEVQAGLRRAFEIARDRRSASIEADDLVLGLLAVRATLGIAWVGDWPVDVKRHIGRLPNGHSTTPPQPSYAAGAIVRHALEQARSEGERVLTWEYAVAACDEAPSSVLGAYSMMSQQAPHSWRAAVASLLRGSSTGTTSTADQVLTLQNAAALLSVHVQTLREYIRQGRLPAYRIAGERAVRVMRGDVLGLLEQVHYEATFVTPSRDKRATRV